MTGKVKLKGDRQLKKLLNTLPKKVHSKVARAGIAEAAKVYRNEMKQRAPRGTGPEAGNLRKNLRYRIKRSRVKKGFFGRVGVTTDAFYARFIEYGSSPHRIVPDKSSDRRSALKFGDNIFRKGVNHPGQSPKPFLRPAFDAANSRAVSETKRVLWKRLLQEVRQ